jgi:hypothetical protein
MIAGFPPPTEVSFASEGPVAMCPPAVPVSSS